MILVLLTCEKCGKEETVSDEPGFNRIVCLECVQNELQIITDLSPEQIEIINQKFREIDNENRNDLSNHIWSDQKPITLGVTRTELKKVKK